MDAYFEVDAVDEEQRAVAQPEQQQQQQRANRDGAQRVEGGAGAVGALEVHCRLGGDGEEDPEDVQQQRREGVRAVAELQLVRRAEEAAKQPQLAHAEKGSCETRTRAEDHQSGVQRSHTERRERESHGLRFGWRWNTLVHLTVEERSAAHVGAVEDEPAAEVDA